ncbi:hypothetical protein D9M73_192050 [compost metagenome]
MRRGSTARNGDDQDIAGLGQASRVSVVCVSTARYRIAVVVGQRDTEWLQATGDRLADAPQANDPDPLSAQAGAQ